MTFYEAQIDYFNRLTSALSANDNELVEFLEIISPDNIAKAHASARRNKSHYKEVQKVNANSDLLADIYEALLLDTYQVSQYSTKVIKDPKERILLKLPYYPDRIIQWVIMQYLEPILMKTYHKHSCASIKKRGIDAAFNLAVEFTQSHKEFTECYHPHHRFKQEDYRYSHCLKIDVRHFYQSISHAKLKEMLSALGINSYVLKLLFKIIDSSNSVPEQKSKMRSGYGLPIGSYVSQHLANLYLTCIDNYISQFKDLAFVRYMDDVLIFGNSALLHSLRKVLCSKLSELELQMKGNWQIYNLSAEGIDFVGYRVKRSYIRLRNTTFARMNKNLNPANAASYYGVAKRTKNKNLLQEKFSQFIA